MSVLQSELKEIEGGNPMAFYPLLPHLLLLPVSNEGWEQDEAVFFGVGGLYIPYQIV